jgi:endo-1,4-beta-xylanase
VKRRDLLIASPALALAACEGRAQPRPRVAAAATTLKAAAPFPVGASVRTARLKEDPAYGGLIARHFDQVTADWEMKMEAILEKDGSFDFDRADAVVAFARAQGLRVFGHTLIWNEQSPDAFERIVGDRAAFAAAYRNYILAVAGRWPGVVTAWDVVNEPLNWNGEEERGGIWAQALGPDYVALAFEHAREADPGAVLFLNDYNLEHFPKKRRAFLRIAEGLLRRGAPLGGLGTQTHLGLDTDPKSIAPALRDLASLGLPVHVSELDVKLEERAGDPAALDAQARLVGAVAEAFAALPARQRFALTTWGVRDSDSWLRDEPKPGEPLERALLLDDAGRPKPAFHAAVEAWS